MALDISYEDGAISLAEIAAAAERLRGHATVTPVLTCAALSALAGEAFGPAGGRLLQATAFGLSHIPDARAAGEPVAGTIAVTGLAGWLFGWLAQRSGSLAAPMLAHLAINEAGALAALVTQRRSAGSTLASAAAREKTASR